MPEMSYLVYFNNLGDVIATKKVTLPEIKNLHRNIPDEFKGFSVRHIDPN